MSGRAPAPLLLAAATALLAGCSSGSAGEPRALEPVPTAATTATATASPAPTAVPSPGQAQEVVEVVRAYYAAVTDAYATGDTAAARALVDPACPCVAQLDGIESLLRSGGTLEGSAYALSESRVAFVQPEAAGVDVTVDVSAGVLRDRTGTVVDESAARTGLPYLVTLRREGPSWRIASVDDRS